MKPGIALLALCLLTPIARADSLESPDAFEAALSKCLMTSTAPAACFEKHLGAKFPPGNEELATVVTQVAEFFKQWLAKDKVFAVHPVKTIRLGAYAERRIYLIEDTTGQIIMFDTSFVRRLGDWHVLKFNLTSKSEGIKAVLGEVL